MSQHILPASELHNVDFLTQEEKNTLIPLIEELGGFVGFSFKTKSNSYGLFKNDRWVYTDGEEEDQRFFSLTGKNYCARTYSFRGLVEHLLVCIEYQNKQKEKDEKRRKPFTIVEAKGLYKIYANGHLLLLRVPFIEAANDIIEFISLYPGHRDWATFGGQLDEADRFKIDYAVELAKRNQVEREKLKEQSPP